MKIHIEREKLERLGICANCNEIWNNGDITDVLAAEKCPACNGHLVSIKEIVVETYVE